MENLVAKYTPLQKIKNFLYNHATGVVTGICWLLIFLFLYTATAKIFDHKDFEGMLAKSFLIGRASHLISIVIPVLEIIVSIIILIPKTKTRLYGLWSSIVLLGGITTYLILMLLFAPVRSCNCGGVISSLSWQQHIVFNFFFLVINALGIFLTRIQLTNFIKTKTPKQ